MPGVNITVGIIVVLLFILIGVMFDMVGVAVAAADEAPFHSMASQKVKGASLAIKMIKNASKVFIFVWAFIFIVGLIIFFVVASQVLPRVLG